MSDNQISNIFALRNLKKLNYLDLTNNCLDDRDFERGGVKYNNLKILANLNKNNSNILLEDRGSLEVLYLEGNKGIINYSDLLDLAWKEKSGF